MIKARFAFYWEFNGKTAPSYMVDQSDNKSLLVGGNVCDSQLRDAGATVPFTPSFEAWVQMGKPVYRGGGFDRSR